MDDWQEMPFTETDTEVEATEMLSSACDWEVKPKSILDGDASGASGTAPPTPLGEWGRQAWWKGQSSNYFCVLGEKNNLNILKIWN